MWGEGALFLACCTRSNAEALHCGTVAQFCQSLSASVHAGEAVV